MRRFWLRQRRDVVEAEEAAPFAHYGSDLQRWVEARFEGELGATGDDVAPFSIRPAYWAVRIGPFRFKGRVDLIFVNRWLPSSEIRWKEPKR